MAISRKIKEVIEAGGEVSADKPSNKHYVAILNRVRADLLEQVNQAVAERAGMSRTAWIQEAIQEKLKRLHEAS